MSLVARQVSFSYRPVPGRADARVLRDVDLTVRSGSVTGLLGPNGCSKTTLLKLLSGVLTPTSGAVTVNGRPMAAMPRREAARQIAVVPQETHPAYDYTVLEIGRAHV